MPGFDQTGPRGGGPMSGKAHRMGCAARSGRRQEESGGYGQGESRGRGRGFRWGIGNRFGGRGVADLRWPEPPENIVKE